MANRTNKKVIARIMGGLGNQLFCYAAARRLALVNGAELVIDHISGFIRDCRYARRYALDRFNIPVRKATATERLEPFERYRRAIAKVVSRHRPFKYRRYIEQEGVAFDSRLLDYKVDGTIYLDGRWQSEGYFKDVEKTIREDLRITPPSDAINQEMADRIRSCESVCVHVRWVDEPNSNTGYKLNISRDYYSQALREISQRTSKPRFFLFSDYPQEARVMLKLQESSVVSVDHNHGDENAYADLWLMTQCSHFVCTKSTFSWWGAWLSQNRKKVVITPSVERSNTLSWGFEGQIPLEWIRL
jgi:hypothetical protein